LVGAIAAFHRTGIIDASSAIAFCTGTFTLYCRGAIDLFDGPIAFVRGGISLFG
jgi:hypothetical protein